MSVSVSPGTTPLTVIWRGPSSRDSERVNCSMADLEPA
jgi:hypothetical protein